MTKCINREITIRATIAIMHDDRRAERLQPLLDQLQDPPPEIQEVFVANGSRGGPWLALFKALFFGPEDRTHTITIEDDAILSRNFLQGAINAIHSRPNDLLYLFASSRQAGYEMKKARGRGCSWAETNPRRTVGTVAACIPRTIAEPFIKWGCSPETMVLSSTLWPHKPMSGDSRLYFWMVNLRGGDFCESYPDCDAAKFPLVSAVSLADHDEDDPQQDSLIGTRQTVARRSPTFIGEGADASAVVFNSEVCEWNPS